MTLRNTNGDVGVYTVIEKMRNNILFLRDINLVKLFELANLLKIKLRIIYCFNFEFLIKYLE